MANDFKKIKKYFFKHLLFAFILLALKTSAHADSIINPIYLSLKTHYGFILPHTVMIQKLASTNPYGIQFDFGKTHLTKKSYQKVNNFANAGLSFHWFNYQYPTVLGHSFNLSAFGEPVFGFHRKIYWSIKTGLGLSFVTKYYDKDKNPENKFFALPISFIVFINPSISIKLSNKTHLSFALSYNHISNGGIKQPNYGMNFPTASLGFSYYPNNFKIPDQKKYQSKNKFSPQKTFAFEFFLTAKNINEGNNFEKDSLIQDDIYKAKLLWLYGFQARWAKTITNRNTLNLALEWISDSYDKERIKRLNLDKDHRKLSFMLGHDFVFGKFNFRQQIGFYLYAPFEQDEMYERYTLSYQITKKIYISASLKAHLHRANIFDARIGIKL